MTFEQSRNATIHGFQMVCQLEVVPSAGSAGEGDCCFGRKAVLRMESDSPWRDTAWAMSEENVELVRRAYAELGPYPAEVDPSAFARFAAPDVELDLSAVYSDAPRVRGLEAAIGLTRSLPWGRSVKLEPERFFDVDDDRVLVFMRVTAKGEGSGVPVELRDAHELTIRDGLCTRIKVYLDRNQALEAAGLRA
jgi:ketosteroid isomerase-like protein